MTTLAFTRSGAGAPLLLLHGIGSSRHAWDPVIPALAAHFDVLAVDLPGFGDSAQLPPAAEPGPAALAAAVAGLLDDLGITGPHVAGNSLGGWVALELASIRPVASLALLSPAGLWRGSVPLYQRASLRATRWLSQHAAGVLSRLVSYRLGRALVLGQTHGRPFRVSPGYARTAIRAMGTCPGFDATMKASAVGYRSGPPIGAPVTVAFGSRDHLLVRRSRRLGELPPATRLAALPHCGHVPMADDPPAVAALITASAARGRPGEPAARRSGQPQSAAKPVSVT
jgi:pimeloyl-ACP methyl ester carboxylesterase